MSGLGSSSAGAGITLINGMAFIEDPIRQKFLSVSRHIVQGGEYSDTIKNRYLKIEGIPTMGQQGALIPRPATVTGVWVKCRNEEEWTLEVRRNGSHLILGSVVVSGGQATKLDLNVDLNAGDWIQVYANGELVKHPIFFVEMAWRLTQ